MSHLLLYINIVSVLHHVPLFPLAPLIAGNPFLYKPMMISVLLVEGLFFLSIFSDRLRHLMISSALLFHCFNAIWLGVTFTPVMIVYGMFIDWQAVIEKMRIRIPSFDANSSRLLVSVTLILAVMTALLWNVGDTLRSAFNLGGLVNMFTIWYPVFPLALISFWRALNSFKTVRDTR